MSRWCSRTDQSLDLSSSNSCQFDLKESDRHLFNSLMSSHTDAPSPIETKDCCVLTDGRRRSIFSGKDVTGYRKIYRSEPDI